MRQKVIKIKTVWKRPDRKHTLWETRALTLSWLSRVIAPSYLWAIDTEVLGTILAWHVMILCAARVLGLESLTSIRTLTWISIWSCDHHAITHPFSSRSSTCTEPLLVRVIGGFGVGLNVLFGTLFLLCLTGTLLAYGVGWGLYRFSSSLCDLLKKKIAEVRQGTQFSCTYIKHVFKIVLRILRSQHLQHILTSK